MATPDPPAHVSGINAGMIALTLLASAPGAAVPGDRILGLAALGVGEVEGGRELLACCDVELAVAAAQMIGHRVHGDEQCLCDFPVGASFGGEPGNSKLARGECIYTSKAGAAGACTGCQRFRLCPFHERHRPAASRDLKRLPQWFPRLNPMALAPESSTQVSQGSCQVQRRGLFLQRLGCRSQQVDRVVAVQPSTCAKGGSDRPPGAGTAGVGEVLLRQLRASSILSSARANASDARQGYRIWFRSR